MPRNADPTIMQIAFAEAQRRAQKYQPKENTMDTRTNSQRIWEYLHNEVEPRNIRQIARDTGIGIPTAQTTVGSMVKKNMLLRHLPKSSTDLMTWTVLPGEHEFGQRKPGPRGRPPGVKNKKPEAKQVAKDPSQVVTSERKVMVALPGGPTINAAGYTLTIAEAKALYKALQELFG